MENYIVIEGKKIELSKETVENLKSQLDIKTYLSFTDDPNSNFQSRVFSGELRFECQIGKNAVNESLRGRCLILSERYNWKIIDNPFKDNGFSKLLVATKE